MTFTNNEEEKSVPDKFLVVGLGASAGGVQALREFFSMVPADSGMAYVVILHLSPDHDSQLASILQLGAVIPVKQVQDRTALQPDNVYIVSPNHHLVLQENHVIPTINTFVEDRRAPVDILFRNMAEELGARAICVILSGTGANGSMGLKRVKERGGAVFVQSPREAQYSEMPRNAIATDLVDEVLPVTEIPAKLIAYKESILHRKIMVDPTDPDEQHRAMREIFMQLRFRMGHDFSNYKRATLLRRIERRMNIHQLNDLPEYAAYIQQHPEETAALMKDLLISVTNFFRDAASWKVIEQELLPRILAGKTASDRLRIWVTACATGEEAYSLAMLCLEKLTGNLDAPRVQIFATDIDESAITVAREGYYSLNDAADVSPERLNRFFNREGEGFRVRREVREIILFANHNFIKDPPFSHLDLVTCRNVLIYLNQLAQERVAETFHFALNANGFLFLGASESVENTGELYTHINREHHIFQAKQVARRFYPVPDGIPQHRSHNLEIDGRSTPREHSGQSKVSFGDLHQQLLEQYAPPSLVVNEQYDIVHLSQRAGRYLSLTGGEMTRNLLKLVNVALRIELRTALYTAVESKSSVEVRALPLVIQEQQEIINLHVRPALRPEKGVQGYILVLFEQVAAEPGTELLVRGDDPAARVLEEELMQTKQQMRNTIEQYEFQGEELKASNEELQAMNEELRSAAEELETSKEELESINEEMRTVNHELKMKIEETTVTSNNLHNLVNSASIGTIFLDRSFRVVLFTPAIRELFNLIPTDHGRPITDITNHLQYPELLQDAEVVLEQLTVVERELAGPKGKVYLLRMLPYRTENDHINGIVITFYDITSRKEAEQEVKKGEERFRVLADSVPQLIWTSDAQGLPSYFNRRWYLYTGLNPDESTAWEPLLYPADADKAIRSWQSALAQGKSFKAEFRLRKHDGNYYWFICRSFPYHDAAGKITSWFSSATDIDDLKQTEMSTRESTQQLELALDAGRLGYFEYNVATGVLSSSLRNKSNFDIPEDAELSFETFRGKIQADHRAAFDAAWNKALIDGEPFDIEVRIQTPENVEKWIKAAGRPFSSGPRSKVQKMVGFTLVITEQRAFTDELARQVSQSTIELQRSNTDLQQFAHVASHDLREPLRKATTFSNRLQREFGPGMPSEALVYIEKIKSATKRMNTMIEGILQYSGLGILDDMMEDIDLDRLIDTIVTDLEIRVEHSAATIRHANLHRVRGNPTLIYQLFYNLISNSLKFGKAGIAPVIDITSGEVIINDRAFNSYTVGDNGIGFDAEFSESIFQAFLRLHSKDKYDGIGLGLSLCRKIVDRHGGSISASGSPDGAVFTILLPK